MTLSTAAPWRRLDPGRLAHDHFGERARAWRARVLVRTETGFAQRQARRRPLRAGCLPRNSALPRQNRVLLKIFDFLLEEARKTIKSDEKLHQILLQVNICIDPCAQCLSHSRPYPASWPGMSTVLRLLLPARSPPISEGEGDCNELKYLDLPRLRSLSCSNGRFHFIYRRFGHPVVLPPAGNFGIAYVKPPVNPRMYENMRGRRLVTAKRPAPPRMSLMSREFSAYLDLIRLMAALIVFCHHVLLQFGCYESSSCGFAPIIIPFHAGHIAVVFFFVLSGYVITYAASERELSLIDFSISRFARIYSVAVPAIVLVMGIDILLTSAGKAGGVPIYQYHGLWKYLPMFLTFTNDFWFLREPTFSDVPFWSLGYEVWYYVAFAAFFYSSRRSRWAYVLLIFLLIGPKLWVMFPIWAMGSLLYRLHRKVTMGVALARSVLGFTIAVLIIAVELNLTGPIDRLADNLSAGWVSHHLRFSQWFAGDTLIAVAFAANLFAARYARLGFPRLISPIRVLASFSFTLYLTHWPLLEFWRVYAGFRMPETIFAVSCCVGLLGLMTERQKDWLRDRLRSLCNERVLRARA